MNTKKMILRKQLISHLLVFSLAVAPVFASEGQKPLKEKENPQLIGKRDINKGQLNFYSLEKEVSIGRQMAAEVERYSNLIDDPIVLEFVNRVTQKLSSIIPRIHQSTGLFKPFVRSDKITLN